MSNVKPRNTASESSMELPAYGTGKLLKTTRSICPDCLQALDAQVLLRDGQVWMDKECPTHGRYSALLSANVRHYYIANETAQPGGSGCGPSPACSRCDVCTKCVFVHMMW